MEMKNEKIWKNWWKISRKISRGESGGKWNMRRIPNQAKLCAAMNAEALGSLRYEIFWKNVKGHESEQLLELENKFAKNFEVFNEKVGKIFYVESFSRQTKETITRGSRKGIKLPLKR